MRKLNGLFLLAPAAALLALVGCEATETKAPAPEPKPLAKTEGPAPASAPAARMSDGLSWSEIAYPTGNKATSAVLLEKGVPASVSVGAPFEYKLRVTNLTSAPLTNVVVSEELAKNFTLAGTTPNADSSAGGKLTWAFASMAPNESKTVSIKGSAPTAGAAEGFCSNVSYNSILCARIPVLQPNLELATVIQPATGTGTAPGGAPLSCDPLEITYTIKNSGTGAIPDAKISDTLPQGMVTAQGGQSKVDVNVGLLNPGEAKAYKVGVKVANPGAFANKAQATGAGLTADATANIKTVKPVLALAMDCPKEIVLGRVTTQEVTASNKGDGEARDAVMEVTLPAGVAFVAAEGATHDPATNKLRWALGTLAPGATKTGKLTYKASAAGTYKTALGAASYCADNQTAMCETTIKGIPAILIELIDVNDPVELGKTETYTITLTNQGMVAGKNIVVVCDIEDTGEYVSSEGSTKATDPSARKVTFNLPELASKAVASWKVTVKALKPGDTRFTVTMTEASLEGRGVKREEATRFYK